MKTPAVPILVLGTLLLSTIFSSGGLAQQKGPGVGNLNYSSGELFNPIAYFYSATPNGKSLRGHANVIIHNGYMVFVYARNGGSPGSGLTFYDLSDPRNPKVAADYFDNRTSDLRESHSFGSSYSYGGEYVVLLAAEGIQFWDWSDIFQPVLLNYLKLPLIEASDYALGAWWLFWQAPYVYVGGSGNGIYIVDASNPEDPQFVKRIPINATGRFRVGPVLAIGNLLVVSSMDEPGYATLDISDPENPYVLQALKNGSEIYSIMVNDYKIFGASGDKRVYAHDITNPKDILFVNSSEPTKGRAEYINYQDGFLHVGVSAEYAKIDVRDDNDYKIVGTAASNIPEHDEDFTTVIGNLVFIGNDHREGSVMVPHQQEPDTTGPEVTMIIPMDGAQKQALTSRVGITMSDQIELHSVNQATFYVRPLGGDILTGKYSGQSNIINFFPDSVLDEFTTYEVIVPQSGMTDWMGNATESDFHSVFSTGSQKVEIDCGINPVSPAEVDEEVIFSVADSVTGNYTYAWDFGDGSPATPFSLERTVAHIFDKPGRFIVELTVSNGEAEKRCSTTQTICLPPTSVRPTESSTIVFDDANNRVWSVNPDNNTITAIDASTYTKLFEKSVGAHPRTLAVAGDGTIWVACETDAEITIHDGISGDLIQTIQLAFGSMPYGITFDPQNEFGYVSLYGSGKLLRVDPALRSVISELKIGSKPRGIAVSADGLRVFVTRFSSPVSHGEIVEINASDFTIDKTFELQLDPGPDAENTGRGVPNYLSAITISPDGQRAWIPSKKDNTGRGLVRDGQKLTFENTVRAIVSEIDLVENKENLKSRLDLNDRSLPFAMKFSLLGDYAFVAISGNNMVEVRDTFDGRLVTAIEKTGFAPQGLTLSPDGNILFIKNFLSRSVSVHDISEIVNSGDNSSIKLANIKTVGNEILQPQILLGKQIFYNAADDRMSREGYLSCSSCHLDGGEDGRVWDFTDRGEGLRNTISLLGRKGTEHGRVHWTGNFDEIQDFEHDIRGPFGGGGFMADSDFFSGTRNETLGDKKAGVSMELDALAAYVASLDQVNASPYRKPNGQLTESAQLGKQIFQDAKCASCHGGEIFTNSANDVLHDVGTLKTNSGKRLGGMLFGLDSPTLKGLWETAPYLHDGGAQKLADVFAGDSTHILPDNLSESEIMQLVDYLLQIDDAEPGFDVNQENGRTIYPLTGSFIANDIPVVFSTEIDAADSTPLSVSYFVKSDNGQVKLGADDFPDDGWEIEWPRSDSGKKRVTTVVSFEDSHTMTLPEVTVKRDESDIVQFMLAESQRFYELSQVALDSAVFIDQETAFTEFPDNFAGHVFVRTANSDRNFSGNEFLQIIFKQPTGIYVAYSADAAQLPQWLTGWEKVEQQIKTTENDFDLYFQTKVDTALLGGNLAFPAQGAAFNYFVILSDKIMTVENRTLKTFDFELTANWPNPFNPETEISFTLPKTTKVALKIFNIRGRVVATLVNKSLSAGKHKVKFKAANLPSGPYFYRLKAGGFVSTKKMLLLK